MWQFKDSQCFAPRSTPPKLHKLLKLRLIYNASNFGVCNQDSFKKDKNPTWVGSFHISWPDSTRRYATLHPTHAGCVCLFFLAAPCGSLFDKTGRKKRPKSASVPFQLLTFSMRFDLWLLISCRLAIGKAVELDRRKNWLWLNPDKSRVNSGLRPSLKAEVFFFGSFGQITTPGLFSSFGRKVILKAFLVCWGKIILPGFQHFLLNVKYQILKDRVPPICQREEGNSRFWSQEARFVSCVYPRVAGCHTQTDQSSGTAASRILAATFGVGFRAKNVCF